MSENPVFDTVQALYPDVHIPDLLEVLQAWGGRTIRHVVTTPPPRKPEINYNDFPMQTVRNPGSAVINIEDRKKLRGPRHGR